MGYCSPQVPLEAAPTDRPCQHGPPTPCRTPSPPGGLLGMRLRAWISHKDNGTLVSVNILNNYIGTEQAHILAAMAPPCGAASAAHLPLLTLAGARGAKCLS